MAEEEDETVLLLEVVLHNFLAIPFKVSIAFSSSYALDLSIGEPDLERVFVSEVAPPS